MEEEKSENTEEKREAEADLDLTKETNEIPEKKSHSFFYSFLFIFSLIIIIVVILVSIRIFSPKTMEQMTEEIIQEGETENGYIYNGFVFIYQAELWNTQVQQGNTLYNTHFHFGPRDVEEIPVIGTLNKSLDMSKFYITLDFSDEKNISLLTTAAAELNLNLVKGMNIETIPACYKNQSRIGETENPCEKRPIINCNSTKEGVIWVRSGASNFVLLDDNCIILQGFEENIFKAVDRMLFDWYKITIPNKKEGEQ